MSNQSADTRNSGRALRGVIPHLSGIQSFNLLYSSTSFPDAPEGRMVALEDESKEYYSYL